MQKRKIVGFLKARELIANGMTVRNAIKECRLSATTFYKYDNIIGEKRPDGNFEMLPQHKPSVSERENVLRAEYNQIMNEIEKAKTAPVVKSEPVKTGTSSFALEEYKRLMEENAKLKDLIIAKELKSFQ